MDGVLKEQMKWEAQGEDERLRPDLAAVEADFTKDYLRKIANAGPRGTAAKMTGSLAVARGPEFEGLAIEARKWLPAAERG